MAPAARAAAAITSSTSTRSLASSTSYSSSTSCRSQQNPMPPWWDSLVKARSAVESLNSIIGPLESLELLLDSEKPARALLDSPQAARLIAERLHHPASGVLSDALCAWLYDTYQSADADLQLVALRYVPLVAGLYLSRVATGLYLSQEEEQSQSQPQQPPLAGFEAVLLALYTTETKARGGRAVVVNIPDLGQASLYHSPRVPAPERFLRTAVGQLSAPLEPQTAVKSTKRAAIVGVALELFYRKIVDMPAAAKVEFCEFAQGWAGQHCACARKFDEEAENAAAAASNKARNPSPNGKSLIDEIGKFSIEETSANGSSHAVCSSAASDQAIDDSRAKGTRVPLPMELLQPMLRILGHCLMGPTNPQDLKDAAASAVRVLFARASHDLVPEAILATRSLIRLDIAARTAARAAAADATASKNGTPVKRKKPEVLLVSK
uniref:TSA: Wollemia nobilis Ref_Wollemi_Transcript_9669_1704 transcribed RNA sequence n=1 Tax=Wollemia nobilis TaxID=56998 RepID=A0A0C9QU46_9CONI